MASRGKSGSGGVIGFVVLAAILGTGGAKSVLTDTLHHTPNTSHATSGGGADNFLGDLFGGSSHPSAGSSAANAPAGSALAAAKSLTVKGRAPKTGYSRAQFGKAWDDNQSAPWGHNGCDTRNDILKRDLANVSFKNAAHCKVTSGTFHDQYTGKTIHFRSGAKSSTAVQIDHGVALSNAWQTGASTWDATKRLQYANDPLVLMASDGPANGAKGDGDTATWLPPNKAFRPCYVAHQVAIKKKYGLWVTQAEKDAMVRELSKAPNTKLPTEPGGLSCG